MEEHVFLERVDEFRKEIEAVASTDMAEKLVRAGWTLPMVREAKQLAEQYGGKFWHVARLRNQGIHFEVLDQLFAARSHRPGLTIPGLRRCWTLCVSARKPYEEDKQFFADFLGALDGLFEEAGERLRSSVARAPAFIFGRLLEYIERSHGDIERVFRELVEDPAGLLTRILETSSRKRERGTQTVIRTHYDSAWGYLDVEDIADLWDDLEGR